MQLSKLLQLVVHVLVLFFQLDNLFLLLLQAPLQLNISSGEISHLHRLLLLYSPDVFQRLFQNLELLLVLRCLRFQFVDCLVFFVATCL